MFDLAETLRQGRTVHVSSRDEKRREKAARALDEKRRFMRIPLKQRRLLKRGQAGDKIYRHLMRRFAQKPYRNTTYQSILLHTQIIRRSCPALYAEIRRCRRSDGGWFIPLGPRNPEYRAVMKANAAIKAAAARFNAEGKIEVSFPASMHEQMEWQDAPLDNFRARVDFTFRDH